MSKFDNPEIQSLVLDLYAMHGTDTTVAMLSCVARTTLWRMSKASEDGEPDLQEVDWGGLIKPFHEHKLDALDIHIEDVQQRMTRDAGQGQWVPVVHGGEPKFMPDEYAVSLTEKDFQYQLAIDDDTREMCGYPRVWHDKMLRTLNPKSGIWERVRVQQYLPPTLDAQSKVLSSFAPETFGDKRCIDMNVNASLGVTIMGRQSIPPPDVMEVIGRPPPQAIVDEAEYAEITDQTEEQPMTQEPFTPDPTSPLTAEQQSILARARSGSPLAADLAARALKKSAEQAAPVAAKPIQPAPPSTYKGDDQDDCIPRNPRGMKVV